MKIELEDLYVGQELWEVWITPHDAPGKFGFESARIKPHLVRITDVNLSSRVYQADRYVPEEGRWVNNLRWRTLWRGNGLYETRLEAIQFWNSQIYAQRDRLTAFHDIKNKTYAKMILPEDDTI